MTGGRKKKTLLPLGSVVLLSKGEGPYMIVSRMPQDDEGKEWDYLGCLHPDGCLSSEELMAFNREHIGILLFIGYQNEAEFAKREELETIQKGNEKEKTID